MKSLHLIQSIHLQTADNQNRSSPRRSPATNSLQHLHIRYSNSPPNLQLETYADDISTLSSSQDIKTAQNRIQPYLNDIFTWTKQDDLQLNPDKSTFTLFTLYPAEYNTTLNLTINNTLIPTIENTWTHTRHKT